jgi:hypothetical protein
MRETQSTRVRAGEVLQRSRPATGQKGASLFYLDCNISTPLQCWPLRIRFTGRFSDILASSMASSTEGMVRPALLLSFPASRPLPVEVARDDPLVQSTIGLQLACSPMVSSPCSHYARQSAPRPTAVWLRRTPPQRQPPSPSYTAPSSTPHVH